MKFNAKHSLLAVALLISLPAFGMDAFLKKTFRIKTNAEKAVEAEAKTKAFEAEKIKALEVTNAHLDVLKEEKRKEDANGIAAMTKDMNASQLVDHLQQFQSEAEKEGASDTHKADYTMMRNEVAKTLGEISKDQYEAMEVSVLTKLYKTNHIAVKDQALAALKVSPFTSKLRSLEYVKSGLLWKEASNKERALLIGVPAAAIAGVALLTTAAVLAYKFLAKNELQKNKAALATIAEKAQAGMDNRALGQEVQTPAASAFDKYASRLTLLTEAQVQELKLAAVAVDASTVKTQQIKLSALNAVVKAMTENAQKAFEVKEANKPESFLAKAKKFFSPASEEVEQAA